MTEDEDNWEEIIRTSDVITAPAADTDLLVIETSYEGRLEAIELFASEDNIFRVIIRDIGGANPVTRKLYYLYSEGQFINQQSFSSPIMTWGAGKEIAVQNVNAAEADTSYGVNMKVWTRRL